MDGSVGVVVGILLVFAAMGAVGVVSMRKVKSSDDFTVAGKSSTPIMIAGTIVGACVGAGGTIGTAETAFKIGIVGWWQTLGLAIGVLVLGLFLSQKIYSMSKAETLPQILAGTFGQRIIPITAIFSSIAIFFSIMSQTKGFLPLLMSVFPVSDVTAAVVCGVLVLLFVVFGGIFATSIGGLLKMFLIIIALLVSAVIALAAMGGFSGMGQIFADQPDTFNMFARGANKDIAIGVGFVLGVLVTQTYVQAVLSAKDAKAARDGCIIGSLMTAPIGLFGVVIGLYMRHTSPDMLASRALPQFMIDNYPTLIAGIFIGALMLSALGSNAGLTLGISTLLTRDLYQRIKPNTTDKERLIVLRTFMVIIVTLSCVLAVTKAGELIQTFIFLSFGMRTTVFLVPMLFAFYYKGRMSQEAGIASCIAGPVVNIVWNLGNLFSVTQVDPIYAGLIASFLAFVIVNRLTRHKINPLQMENETQKVEAT